MNQQMRIRKWADLDFLDPAEVLAKLNDVEQQVADSDHSDQKKALRTIELKPLRECRQAALFAMGLRVFTGNPTIEFSPYEADDFDAVFRRLQPDAIEYTPVQLKEVVPDRWNPKASVNEVIQNLLRLGSSSDLVVGIHHTRPTENGCLELIIPKELKLAGLFVFGCASEDRSKWFMSGDLLTDDVGGIYYEIPTR